MKTRTLGRQTMAVVLALGVATALASCGKKEEPAAAATPTAPPTAPTAAAPAAPPAPVTAAEVANQTWTAEALEDLLAPVALYPDPVLSQVLIASTNPQEVLDAGNWLIANESLKGKALDDGAAQAGFTPPVRALVQFPQTIDLMCMEMGWTTELGQAFVADQAGVLDAVQRLRKQAIDVGNLQTSQAMIVETQQQEGQEVVVLKPPKPEVVYVPTYDPQAAYAPPPATPAVATTETTTMTPVEDKTKYDKGDMIMTGVLAFGAGILVNEIFDDDDHHHKNHYNDYYYPNYGYGGMPYYPPYPYRPVYGGGYYPSNNYNRPPNWNNGGFQNNGNIIINTGGNSYWDRYPSQARPVAYNGAKPYTKQARTVSSPITKANPNRKDLQQVNQRQPRPMPADYKRPSPTATASNWKGQSTYAGRDNRPASAKTPQERIDSAVPRYSQPASNARPSTAQGKVPPKVSGSYAGKDRPRPPGNAMPNTRDLSKPPQRPDTRDMQKPAKMPQQKPANMSQQKPQTRDMQRPQPKPMPSGDRGYGNTRDMQRPTASPQPMNRPAPMPKGGGGGGYSNKGTAMSGAGGNRNTANAASQRGKQSMPQGARSKGGGGGGGGKNKNKQAR